jgi:hypothetical protein
MITVTDVHRDSDRDSDSVTAGRCPACQNLPVKCVVLRVTHCHESLRLRLTIKPEVHHHAAASANIH